MIRFALLNCNGLFDNHGQLSSAWHPLASSLHSHGTHALLLSEPHLHVGSRLPSDSLYDLAAFPHDSCRIGRRDCAIALHPSASSFWHPLVSTCRDIVGLISGNDAYAVPICLISAYAPDTSRGVAARIDFFSIVWGMLCSGGRGNTHTQSWCLAWIRTHGIPRWTPSAAGVLTSVVSCAFLAV